MQIKIIYIQHHRSWWAKALENVSFHLFLSTAFSLQSRIPSSSRRCSVALNQFVLDRPLILPPVIPLACLAAFPVTIQYRLLGHLNLCVQSTMVVIAMQRRILLIGFTICVKHHHLLNRIFKHKLCEELSKRQMAMMI